MPLCPNCGHDNEDGARYCVDCGVELGRTTTPDTHPDEAVTSDSWTEREQEVDGDGA